VQRQNVIVVNDLLPDVGCGIEILHQITRAIAVRGGRSTDEISNDCQPSRFLISRKKQKDADSDCRQKMNSERRF